MDSYNQSYTISVPRVLPHFPRRMDKSIIVHIFSAPHPHKPRGLGFRAEGLGGVNP